MTSEKETESAAPAETDERVVHTDDRPIRHYVVRYGSSRLLGEFTTRRNSPYRRSDQVIVRSDRGVEWGEVLCEANDTTRKYIEESNPPRKKKTGEEPRKEEPKQPGKIIRLVEAADEEARSEILQKEKEEFEECGKMIEERSMQMRLVDVEHLFGGERIVFYYLAEQRVDFRELVKALAKRFRARIEMRQIGVRDEAKLLADYGDCGKPVCCNTHLAQMPPVSMKMAKVQKATLDPTKISGRCGRLKCCLRYEYDTYQEFQRELPKVGEFVKTKVGEGKVVAQEILAKKVIVLYDQGRSVLTDQNEILTVVKKKKPPAEKQKDAAPAEKKD